MIKEKYYQEEQQVLVLNIKEKSQQLLKEQDTLQSLHIHKTNFGFKDVRLERLFCMLFYFNLCLQNCI